MACRIVIARSLLLLLVSGCIVSGDELVLPCYTCTSTSADTNCYDDPDNAGSVPVTDCMLGPNMCCVIQRVDERENQGTPLSFFRGCIEDCPEENLGTMVETPDFTHITYQTYCNEPRCNTGHGDTQPGSSGGGGEFIDGIQGVDGAGNMVASAALVVGALLLLLL